MPSSISWGLLLLAGVCCLVPSTQAEDTQELDASDHEHGHEEHLACHNISYKVIDLAFAFYRGLATGSETNILFSPVGITAAIAMLSLGAKGDTHTQMLEGLGFNLTEIPEAKIHECFQHLPRTFRPPDHQLQLTTGSSLFINESLRLEEKFVQDVKKLYHSEAISINFGDTSGAVKEINDQVERESQGTVMNLVKDLEKDTALALVNYITFHGKWNEEFQAKRDIVEDFHVDEKTTIKVPMFNLLGRFYLHRDEELSSWVLVQHYLGDITAFSILPDPGKMQQLEERLTHQHFENVLRHIDMRSANVYFPKLSISGTYDLKSVLSTLGITKVFSNEADLSGVTKGAPLKLSKAVHKAVLTFDEVETRAPTAITVHESESAWSEVPRITFNRPFLLIIKDEYTNFPLFAGKVVNPTQE